MAIELFTGKPGAGKTHHAVQRGLAALKAGRPVYVSNMNGMMIPGAIPFEDPRKWEDLPAGSLLIVDEAQRFWRASRAMDVPPELQAAETHRHMGVDMLLTTQQPTYLLKHLRGLIMPHTHHERLTKTTTRTYKWQNRCVDDPESQGERELSEQGVHVLTKAEFKAYTSTEQDTHKPKIPRRLIVVGIIAALVVAMLWWVNHRVSNLSTDADTPAESAVSPKGSRLIPGTDRRAEPMTSTEYLDNLTPRFGAVPWTAPVFDDRKASSEPEVYCMASARGVNAQGEHVAESCSCITEQGTNYRIEFAACRLIARNGPMYNPYRKPERQGQGQAQQANAPLPQPVVAAAASSAGKQEFGTVASYGGMGVGVDARPR